MDWSNILAVIGILGFIGTTVNVVYSTRANRKKLSQDHDNDVKARALMEEQVKSHESAIQRAHNRIDQIDKIIQESNFKHHETTTQLDSLAQVMARIEASMSEMKADLKEHIKEHGK